MAKETNVIQNGEDAKHVIEGYHFKVMSELDLASSEPPPTSQNTAKELNQNAILDQGPSCELPSEPVVQTNTPPEFIENILKKTDEMSDNIIKLQMQIESQENEFKSRLESELENAKEKYLKEGEEKAKADFDAKIQELNDKFLKSIEKIDDMSLKIETAYKKNEEELSQSALEIAKEVIAKELDENSKQIALNLCKELISELKTASKVEVRLNPKDYDFVKNNLSLNDGIKLNQDDAISAGSVIVLSDAGNMQSGAKERLYKITKMINP